MIRLARPSDIEGIASMIAAAVELMRAEGSDQWDDSYPARADFLGDIGSGQLYVDEAEDGEPAVRAVACLNREQPAEYGTVRWSREGEALVIHRLAVHPACRGQGLAKALFALAEREARSRGIPCIRSDTYSLNGKMNALFAAMGYRRTGEIRFHGRRAPFYCYDKVLDRAGYPAP